MSARSSGSGRSVSARSVTSTTSVGPAARRAGQVVLERARVGVDEQRRTARPGRRRGRPPARPRGRRGRARRRSPARGRRRTALRARPPVSAAAARQRLVADDAAVAQVDDRLVDAARCRDGVESSTDVHSSSGRSLHSCVLNRLSGRRRHIRLSTSSRVASARDERGLFGHAAAAQAGHQARARVLLLGAPDGLRDALGELPDGVKLAHRGAREGRRDRQLPRPSAPTSSGGCRALRELMEPAAGLWIAWPKRASEGADRPDRGRRARARAGEPARGQQGRARSTRRGAGCGW